MSIISLGKNKIYLPTILAPPNLNTHFSPYHPQAGGCFISKHPDITIIPGPQNSCKKYFCEHLKHSFAASYALYATMMLLPSDLPKTIFLHN